MKIHVRLSACMIAGALGAVGLVGPFAVPASAAALKPSVSCSKVNATLAITTLTLSTTFSGCTPAALKAGASSKGKVSKSNTKYTSILTWKNKQGTTKASLVSKNETAPLNCPKGTIRVTITGKVISSTGAAAKIMKAGEPVTASLCAISDPKNGPLGKTTIRPGTKAKF